VIARNHRELVTDLAGGSRFLFAIAFDIAKRLYWAFGWRSTADIMSSREIANNPPSRQDPGQDVDFLLETRPNRGCLLSHPRKCALREDDPVISTSASHWESNGVPFSVHAPGVAARNVHINFAPVPVEIGPWLWGECLAAGTVLYGLNTLGASLAGAEYTSVGHRQKRPDDLGSG